MHLGRPTTFEISIKKAELVGSLSYNVLYRVTACGAVLRCAETGTRETGPALESERRRARIWTRRGACHQGSTASQREAPCAADPRWAWAMLLSGSTAHYAKSLIVLLVSVLIVIIADVVRLSFVPVLEGDAAQQGAHAGSKHNQKGMSSPYIVFVREAHLSCSGRSL